MSSCEFYKVSKVIELKSGLLSLSEEQVRRRGASVTPTNDGMYRILKPVQFKAGEEFGFAGILPKAITGVTQMDKKPKETLTLKKKP